VSFAGHADVGAFVPLALVADAIHLTAMSLWIGGLVVLAVAALALCDLDDLDDIVPRFSQLALACMCALIVTGAYQTWRQVGGLEAFRRTDFGQLLTIKLAIFAVLLVVATRSRSITNYLSDSRSPPNRNSSPSCQAAPTITHPQGPHSPTRATDRTMNPRTTSTTTSTTTSNGEPFVVSSPSK
jgi:copper transport protein